jgi:CBS domain containing-hemolysin-like protein
MSQWAIWVSFGAAILGSAASSAQMSLRTVSKGRVRAAATRLGRLERVEPILDDAMSHALAASLLRTICSVTLVAASVVWMTGMEEGERITWPGLLGAAALSLTLIYLAMVVAPMSIAEHVGDTLIARFTGPIRAMHFLCFPLVRTVRLVDVVVKRLAGVNEEDDNEEIEREIISVVSEGESEGTLAESERDMIEAVVEMRSKTVSETMTPRTEIEGIENTSDLAAIKAFIAEAGHSRIPVYEGDLDHILGILYAKDLIAFVGEKADEFDLKQALRSAWFVPHTKPLLELLRDFQREKVHLAIVLDEYGGTAGLVTIEDVMEEIVGEIRDEYEPVDEQAPEISVFAAEHAAVIDARAYIEDVNDALEDLSLALPESEDYDTVAGFVTTELGRIPEAGEEFRKNGFLVKVLEAEPTRVRRVRIEFRPPEEAPAAEPAADETEPKPAG